MELRWLKLHNFQAIADAFLDLRNRGVVHVVGVNKDDGSSQSNGAGKSSLVSDGLLYALFGQTSKGRSGPSVVNRFGKGAMRVSVQFTVDGDKLAWTVRRTREDDRAALRLLHGSQDVTLGTSKETQDKIEQIIGVDRQTFASSVIFGQGSMKPFSEMTDSEQKQVFSRILGLGEIDRWKKNAASRLLHLSDVRVKLGLREQSILGELKQLEHSLVSLGSMRKNWKKLHARRVSGLRFDIQSNQKAMREGLSAVSRKTKTVERDLGPASAKLQRLIDEEKGLESKLHEIDVRVAAIRYKLRDRKRELVSAAIQLTDYVKLKDSTCPLCRSTVHAEHWEKVKQELEQALTHARGLHRSQKRVYKQSGVDVGAVTQKLKKVTKARLATEDIVHGLEGDLTRMERRRRLVESIRPLIVEQKKLLAATLKEQFTGGKELVKQRKFISVLWLRLRKVRAKIKKVERNQPYVKFWESAFGNSGLKSFILDSVAPYLTKRANLYSEILTGGNVEIEFQTMKALKSGDLRDAFNVVARNRYGSEDYDGASEGEKDKIKLCTGLAMQDLVRTRSKIRVNVAVFDEPSKYVDTAGLEKFLDLLDSNLVKAETVFVVAHNPLFQGHFEKEIRVVKQGGQAHVE